MTARPAHLSVRDLADRHGIRPSKALGQNFLTDPNMAKAIVTDAGIGRGDRVVEVGAGLGSLTRAIAEAGPEEVLALEFDRSLMPALQEAVGREAVGGSQQVRLLLADATKVDWGELLGAGEWVLCANLPYNVGTRIVVDVLEHAPRVTRLVVMLQKEVGERLVAHPGHEAYGAVTVKVGFCARGEIVRRVPPDVFWPRPAVGSVVVRLERLPAPPVDVDRARLWRVVNEAFAQRRKNMRNALRRLGLDAEEADEVLRSSGLDPEVRAEEVGLVEFARLAEAVP